MDNNFTRPSPPGNRRNLSSNQTKLLSSPYKSPQSNNKRRKKKSKIDGLGDLGKAFQRTQTRFNRFASKQALDNASLGSDVYCKHTDNKWYVVTLQSLNGDNFIVQWPNSTIQHFKHTDVPSLVSASKPKRAKVHQWKNPVKQQKRSRASKHEAKHVKPKPTPPTNTKGSGNGSPKKKRTKVSSTPPVVKHSKFCCCGCGNCISGPGDICFKVPKSKNQNQAVTAKLWLKQCNPGLEDHLIEAQLDATSLGNLKFHQHHFSKRTPGVPGYYRVSVNGRIRLDKAAVPHPYRILPMVGAKIRQENKQKEDDAYIAVAGPNELRRMLQSRVLQRNIDQKNMKENEIKLNRAHDNLHDSEKKRKALKEELKKEKIRANLFERMAKEHAEEITSLKEEYNDLFDVGVPFRAEMLKKGGLLHGKCKTSCGFGSYNSFKKFVAFLDAGGMLSKVRIYRGEQQENTKFRSIQKTSEHRSKRAVHWGKRALDQANSIFFVLFCLSTGLDHTYVSSLFGMSESTASRYFTTYVIFLSKFLRAEMPYPTRSQMANAVPTAFAEKYPQFLIELLGDAMEQRTQMPFDLKTYRTMFSSYKHFCTVKFIAGIAPIGAFIFAPPFAFPGGAGDVGATKACGILDLLHSGTQSFWDKGFMIQAFCDAIAHHLNVPPKKWDRKTKFSGDDMDRTHYVGNIRIYIEEAFQRLRTFKIMREHVKVQMFDLIGHVFTCCAYLQNFQGPLKYHDDIDNGQSVYEMLWYKGFVDEMEEL